MTVTFACYNITERPPLRLRENHRFVHARAGRAFKQRGPQVRPNLIAFQVRRMVPHMQVPFERSLLVLQHVAGSLRKTKTRTSIVAEIGEFKYCDCRKYLRS